MLNALLTETVFNKQWCNILALVAVNRFIVAIIYRTKPSVYVKWQSDRSHNLKKISDTEVTSDVTVLELNVGSTENWNTSTIL